MHVPFNLVKLSLMLRRAPLLFGIALLLKAQVAEGQGSPRVHAVVGTVFDSVAGAVLAGATVQLAVPGDATPPRTAMTDAAGRYRFEGVPAGRYVLGFYHDVLTALGLDAPVRMVEVGEHATVDTHLAVPSSATVRMLRCGEPIPFAPGMLVGTVRDADSHATVLGVAVTVHWRALALDSGDYRVVSERRTGAIGPDGSFVVCHLPVDVPLALRVTAPSHHDVDGTVLSIPTTGVAQLELSLADSAVQTGPAVVRGRVARESGKSVMSGRVLIKALSRTVPVVNGTFTVAGLPTGTWVVQAQVMGVEPQDALVTVLATEVAATTITVGNDPQRLDAVTVVGKMDRNLRVLDDVLRRSRIGMGTTFLPGHPALRSAHFVSDVMREARGFLWMGPAKIRGRPKPSGQRCSNVAVYVDEVRQPDGFTWLDHAVSVKNVLAIETWPDIRFAPVQYRRGTELTPMNVPVSEEPRSPEGRPCALVLVWTNRLF
jgi:hypothetical protein